MRLDLALPGKECCVEVAAQEFNKVLVSFRSKLTPDKEAFELYLHYDLDCWAVCDEVARHVNRLNLSAPQPAVGDRLQLWKHSRRIGGPERHPVHLKLKIAVRDLLNDDDQSGLPIVYYGYSMKQMRFGGEGVEHFVQRAEEESVKSLESLRSEEMCLHC